MLESEAKLAVSKPDEVFVVSWSGSGKAFRITDVDEFAGTVLPKYFRTKKFSSFQRNLNLVRTKMFLKRYLIYLEEANYPPSWTTGTVWVHKGAPGT